MSDMESNTNMPDWPAFKVDRLFAADDPYAACRALSAHNQMLHGQVNTLIYLLVGLCTQEGGDLRITADTIK